MKSAVAGLFLSLLAVGPCQAAAEIKLADNVFLVPDPKAKIVTLWMVVRAGCRDEEGGQCRGLAHYLEHLLFLGRSAATAADDADSAFGAGQTNAFTNMNVTSYYQSIPVRPATLPQDLDSLFGLFARRLTHIDVEEEVARRERNVVLQEYNFRRAGSVRASYYNELNARLQPGHPVGQSVIGTRSDIDAFTLEAAKRFHGRWYAPNNVTFIVYGPLQAEDVADRVKKFIEPLPPRKVPNRDWLDARRSLEPMEETVRVADPEAQREEVLLQKIIRFEDPDPDVNGNASAVLLDYVNSQMTGSLSDVFVEDRRLATSVRASATTLGAGVIWLTVSATLEDGVQPETMKAGIESYLTALAQRGVEASVVERLKRRRANSLTDTMKDPRRVLSALTNWFSGLRTHAAWTMRAENLASVTPTTIQPILDAMAGPGRTVFGILSPKKS